VKKTLKWFAAALLFATLAMPTALMAVEPEPPCPNCQPGIPPLPTPPQK